MSDLVAGTGVTVRYIRWMGNNFGDNLNDVLFQEIFGINSAAHNGTPQQDGINLLGIGTLLNEYIDYSGSATAWVLGSGAGNAKPPSMPQNSKIFFVRGPLTCQYLNWPKSLALADAAYFLIDRFHEAVRDNPLPSRPYGIIPHHWSSESNLPKWHALHHQIPIISPHLPWQDFLRQVDACEIVLTECLHGAIAADILRKPFIMFATTPAIHLFKWLDWAASMDLRLSFNFFDFDDPEAICKSGEPVMSSPQVFERIQEKMAEKRREIQSCLAGL